MARRIIYILLTIASTCILLAGCGGTPRDDRRLALADSLMWSDPDSALAIVRAVSPASLNTDGDRAYRALLLTQASYRCYVPLTSDSLISAAAEYYRTAGNRERYTRSLLYSGAAHEDMGNPVEAMRWYKLAEAAADTGDYRNLAQLNMRMGVIYYDNYAGNNLDLEKFEKALSYYNILGDEKMIMNCLGYIGNLNRIGDKDKAMNDLIQAAEIAKILKDTASYYLYLNDLSMAYFMNSDYAMARKAALECVNSANPTNEMFYNASNAYALLGKTDSARFYLDKIELDSRNNHEMMLRSHTLSNILKAEGNDSEALRHESEANHVASTIESSSNRNLLFKVEVEHNDKRMRNANILIMLQSRWIMILGVVVMILISILVAYNLIVKSRYRSKINMLINERDRINNLLREYTHGDAGKKEFNNLITDFMTEQFNALKRLVEQSNSMKYSEFIKLLKHESLKFSENKNVDKLLPFLVNEKCRNFSDIISRQYPQLSPNEIKIICLVALGYNNDSIAFCVGMTKESVRTKKTRIKNKMNIDMSLDNYIKEQVLMLTGR